MYTSLCFHILQPPALFSCKRCHAPELTSSKVADTGGWKAGIPCLQTPKIISGPQICMTAICTVQDQPCPLNAEAASLEALMTIPRIKRAMWKSALAKTAQPIHNTSGIEDTHSAFHILQCGNNPINV